MYHKIKISHNEKVYVYFTSLKDRKKSHSHLSHILTDDLFSTSTLFIRLTVNRHSITFHPNETTIIEVSRPTLLEQALHLVLVLFRLR